MNKGIFLCDEGCGRCDGANRLEFNISGVGTGETLLEAELHLFVLNSSGLQPHVVSIDLNYRLK